MFRQWLHFNNRCHPSMPSDKIYLPLQPYTTTIPTKGQNCISISVALSCLSLLLIQLATPVVQSYLRYYRYRNTSIHEGTVPSTYRSTAALYQGTLPSYSYTIYYSASRNQTAAQPWSPKRRQRAATKRRSICYMLMLLLQLPPDFD